MLAFLKEGRYTFSAMKPWLKWTQTLVIGLLILLLGSSLSSFAQEESASQSEALFEKGVALMEKGDFNEALPIFESIIKEEPESPEVYYAAAVCLARKPQPDPSAARQRHKQAVKLGYQYSEWLENYIDQLEK